MGAIHFLLRTVGMMLALLALLTDSFVLRSSLPTSSCLPLHMATTGEEKAAQLISGADLEVMLADLETPLVVDAYATWYDFGIPFVVLITTLYWVHSPRVPFHI
jgi:hypothetical protein